MSQLLLGNIRYRYTRNDSPSISIHSKVLFWRSTDKKYGCVLWYSKLILLFQYQSKETRT